MLIIVRDPASGRARYSVVASPPASTQPGDLQTTPRIRTRDVRDVPFDVWCETHRAQLRRMLRFLRARLSRGQVVVRDDNQDKQAAGGWDWEGMAASLARYVYATSENRRKATPSVV